MKRKAQPVYCTTEEFIVAWQASTNVQEVSDKLGKPLGSCRQTASNLRARGVPLRKYDAGRRKLDIKALSKLAVDSLPKPEESK